MYNYKVSQVLMKYPGQVSLYCFSLTLIDLQSDNTTIMRDHSAQNISIMFEDEPRVPKHKEFFFDQQAITANIDTVFVNEEGVVLWKSSPLQFGISAAVTSKTGMSLESLFADILSSTDLSTLRSRLVQKEIPRFSEVFQTCGLVVRNLAITGQVIEENLPFSGWLLTLHDISFCYGLLDRLQYLETELNTILEKQETQLEEATASLIETNVALRREIRDRQNTLEALSQSEARFRDLTETTSDFIWEVNGEGTYTYVSPKIKELLGVQPQDLLGKQLLLLRNKKTSELFDKNTQQDGIIVSGFTKIEYSCQHPDGRQIRVESSGEPIFSKHNACVGFRGIDRDVTERHIYETKLREAKEVAESANHAKSEFLANMSHELRTPLHAILSFAKYGEKKINISKRKDLLRFFKQIETSGQRLLPLIDSLLDLAKLEAGKMSYEMRNHDLAKEVKSAIHEIMPLAEKKGVSIDIQPVSISTLACFDQATIAQVIRNILSNALKFCTENSTVTVSFTKFFDQTQREMLQTTVANWGVEIPDDELFTIFDKFAQSSKTKTGAGGTGLGLSICKQIIEDHHGSIWAANCISGETHFHLTLPCYHVES